MKMWKTTNPSSWFLAGMVWFINNICLTVCVGCTQKARASTHFLLKFWSEFNDCRMQLQSGGTSGCVRVHCWLAGG